MIQFDTMIKRRGPYNELKEHPTSTDTITLINNFNTFYYQIWKFTATETHNMSMT